MDQIRDFLKFEGKQIYYLLEKGKWWIALKPVCDALEVDWIRQFKNLQEDIILKDIYQTKKIYGIGNQSRGLVCLPEQYFYGWLFQVQSDSRDLQVYKWKCYQLLYEYFSGYIAQRQHLLIDKYSHEERLAKLEEKLADNDDFIQYQQLKGEHKKYGRALSQLDNDWLKRQPDLFSQK